MKRTRTIDLLKGGLIILVIVGHVLPGEFHASLLRWLIYSFHMPLFIAVSGYLFPWDTIGQYSFRAVFLRYRGRVLVPWLVALTVYAAIGTPTEGLFSGQYWGEFFGHFLRPFFHLWFIAAYLLFVLLSWGLLRLRCSLRQVLIVSVVIAFACEFLRRHVMPLTGDHFSVADFLLYSVRSSYYLFFVLGGFLRRYKVGFPVRLLLPLVFLFAVGEVVLFYRPTDLLETIWFFGFNVCLVLLMAAVIGRWPDLRQPLLEWIGVNSLGIYLWHVIPLMWVAQLHWVDGWATYSLRAVLIAVLFVIVRLTSRWPVVGRVLYGV